MTSEFQLTEGNSLLDDLFWSSIERTLSAELDLDFVKSLTVCDIHHGNQGRDINVVIWRVAYLSALALGSIDTPEKNADTAVRTYKNRWKNSPGHLSMQRWTWLVAYLPELIKQHPFQAKDAADKSVRQIKSQNQTLFYQSQIDVSMGNNND
ncbi:hypothetical protein GGR60_000950 [Xanthomonas arboricola]|uniref:hypothetical protein n=1 Tax=Xanthomonas euroxanthea TaxID=2259622 RepID=UPI0014317DAC|nr:hypothetical protein [Xanthomonas euroxanthea]NJC36460.1 hypothetical protein [Xanthomonas euroxanthea]